MATSPRSATDFNFDAILNGQTRSIATQTDINPKDYVPAQVLSRFELETEVYPSLIRRPRMLSALFLIIVVFTYAVYHIEAPAGPNSFVQNSRQ